MQFSKEYVCTDLVFMIFKAEGVEIELRVLNKTCGHYDELSKMVKIISVCCLGPEISTKT